MLSKFFLYFLLIVGILSSADHGHGEMTTAQAWGYSSLAGIGIICVGLFAALIVIGIRQCITERTFKIIKNVLQGIGCGTVVSTAFVHLLPNAFKDASTNSNIAALIVILAIGFFILMNRIFSSCGVS